MTVDEWEKMTPEEHPQGIWGLILDGIKILGKLELQRLAAADKAREQGKDDG